MNINQLLKKKTENYKNLEIKLPNPIKEKENKIELVRFITTW